MFNSKRCGSNICMVAAWRTYMLPLFYYYHQLLPQETVYYSCIEHSAPDSYPACIATVAR